MREVVVAKGQAHGMKPLTPRLAALTSGFLLYCPALTLEGDSHVVCTVPETALQRVPALALGRIHSRGSDADGFVTLAAELDGAIVRLLTTRDGSFVRGLPVRFVMADPEQAVCLVRGALVASPPRPHAGGWTVSCPTPERALALVGLLRRCGVSSRTSARRPDVKIPATECKALKALGVPVPALMPRRTAPTVVIGQEVLDGINAERRAEQEGRTRRALDVLGDGCPPALRRAAEMRIQFPELSLEALGQLMEPPATRHAVCGQLRRLHQLAVRAGGLPES